MMMNTKQVIQAKKDLLSKSALDAFLMRNIRRLELNLREYKLQLDDIHNAYPFGRESAPRHIGWEFDRLTDNISETESDLKQFRKGLEL